MKLKKVREGKIDIFVPDVELPEEGKNYGFYNPRMRFDRNISVCVISVFRKIFEKRFGKQPMVCDLLCATGVRGIRYVKEAGVENVVINDKNPNAIELAKRNVLENGVEIEISNVDANKLLLERRFDVIDIDPFGSPYPFIDCAAQSLNKFSLLCVTATDLPVLFGIYPKVCLRRYGIRSCRCDFENELGLRILISFVIRELAKYDLAFQPILSYVRKHWIRLFGLVERSLSKVDEILKAFKYLDIDDTRIGSIYMGEIKNDFFCSMISEEIKKRDFKEEMRLINTIISELNLPFYFDLSKIAKRYKKKLVKIERVVDDLRKKGFAATRTHFSSTGIKTDATEKEILDILY